MKSIRFSYIIDTQQVKETNEDTKFQLHGKRNIKNYNHERKRKVALKSSTIHEVQHSRVHKRLPFQSLENFIKLLGRIFQT